MEGEKGELIGADDPRVDWYIDEFEPDDPDEVAAKEREAFRSSEKAQVIRDLLRKGKTAAEIKLYGPAILERREKDGIKKIKEGQGRRVRRIIGRPAGSLAARRKRRNG